MKRCFLITIYTLLVATIPSCNEDDAVTDNTDTNLLTGTWTIADADYTVLGIRQQGDASGTITFNEDGTGKNDYTFTVRGVTSEKRDVFNWESNDTSILFDKGTEYENIWTWHVNSELRQEASFIEKEPITGLNIKVNVTLIK